MPLFVLWLVPQPAGRRTVGESVEATEGSAVSSPQGVVTIGICYWLFVSARCRRRPAHPIAFSQSITSRVRTTVQPRIPESPPLGFLSNRCPQTIAHLEVKNRPRRAIYT
jgi:hypothetical protein